jgi:NADPH:quinone reductase-like Zn-dependent oxidoreductase
MKAVRQHPPGGLASLVYEEVETPQPGPGEALVRVHAAAITRDELDWPSERLPAIPSYELSGVVEGVGADVDDVEVGEEVYALGDFDREGAAAEFTLVRSDFLAPKPRNLDHVESAAIPLAALSAWQGLFVHGGLEEGQRVLIHGAAGGVGHLAVQLARSRGAAVAATFEEVDGGVDLVFDTAGGEKLERSLAALRPGGRLVSIAAEPPSAPGITSVYFVVEPSREQLVELAGLVERGQLRPTVAGVFELAEAREAFERLEQRPRGKIVLRVV